MRLNRPTIAMEAGGGSIRLALVKSRDLQLSTLQAFTVEEGTDEDGRPSRPDKIQSVLKSFMSANSLPKNTNVLLLIKSHVSMFRFAELPKLPEKELKKLAKLNHHNYLPVNTEDYLLDYRILHITDSAAKAVFAAFPRDISETYVSIFRELGLVPVRIELYQNSVADYFVSLNKRRLLAVSRHGSHRSVIFVGSDCMQGVKELMVCGEEQLKEDIGKLPGYFVYAPIDTIYFMEEGYEKELWSAAFPYSSFVSLTEPHLALQTFVRGHYKNIRR